MRRGRAREVGFHIGLVSSLSNLACVAYANYGYIGCVRS